MIQTGGVLVVHRCPVVGIVRNNVKVKDETGCSVREVV
jgi:hypothetical protein